jgi:hypothetical protein
MIYLEEDDFLNIQLVSFDSPNAETERFYFLEMSTLQATTLIQKNRRIKNIEISAYTDEKEFIDELTSSSFNNIGDFNDFFLKNENFYIHNCDLELENSLVLRSHDDGEVSIQFNKNSEDSIIIDKIFKKYNLHLNIIEHLKSKAGHYLAINKQGNVIADYVSFDEYLIKGRI